MIELTRGRRRHRAGRAQTARICGGRLPRCGATAVSPPIGTLPPVCAQMRCCAHDRKPPRSRRRRAQIAHRKFLRQSAPRPSRTQLRSIAASGNTAARPVVVPQVACV